MMQATDRAHLAATIGLRRSPRNPLLWLALCYLAGIEWWKVTQKAWMLLGRQRLVNPWSFLGSLMAAVALSVMAAEELYGELVVER